MMSSLLVVEITVAVRENKNRQAKMLGAERRCVSRIAEIISVGLKS